VHTLLQHASLPSTALERALRVCAPVLVAAAVIGVNAAHGSRSPASWGWIAVVGFAAASVRLPFVRGRRLSAFELAMLGSLVSLVVWTSVSIGWSFSVPASILELQRTLAYFATAFAVMLWWPRSRMLALFGGLCAGVALLCTYSLSTRLFPERLQAVYPFDRYRLAAPIGYWNALGLLAAIGVLLALGIVVASPRRLHRAAAGASLPITTLTLYFTFSRGAWLSLAAGALAFLAVDPRRLGTLARSLVAAAVPCIAVWRASTYEALVSEGHPLRAMSTAGHRFALLVLAFVVLSAVFAAALPVGDLRIPLPQHARKLIGAALAVVVVGAAVAGIVRAGDPLTLPSRSYHAFTGEPPDINGSLDSRLFSFSSSGRTKYWRVAVDEYSAHPVVGTGAGTFATVWLQKRPINGFVGEAHSLYVETLLELGPLGLLLVTLLLLVPLLAALRARHSPLVPSACAVVVAYATHAAGEWDWELPGVTLVALVCGLAIAAEARKRERLSIASPRLAVVLAAMLLCALAFSFVGLLGNSALAAAFRSARSHSWEVAHKQARTATRLLPWSSDAWLVLGRAQLALGDSTRARHSFSVAVSRDPRNWEAWLALARTSSGPEREAAVARLELLNPRAPALRRLARTP
jgi:hypothetical protein